jgi:hypothetical protein
MHAGENCAHAHLKKGSQETQVLCKLACNNRTNRTPENRGWSSVDFAHFAHLKKGVSCMRAITHFAHPKRVLASVKNNGITTVALASEQPRNSRAGSLRTGN